MYKRFLLFFILFLAITSFANAQNHKKDSVATKSDSLIQEVKVFASKNTLVSKLLRNFLIIEKKAKPTRTKRYSNKSYTDYEGKYIRNIDITVLEVFGASIHNIKQKERSWLEKTGNKVHKSTKEWVIRHRLLFKEGEPLDPLTISETERILRQYNNTYDARIIANKVPENKDSVDLYVVVQDVWNITPSGSFDPSRSSGNLGIRDVNFLGFGNELYGKLMYNKRDTTPWHYSLQYTNNNIVHTFIIGNAYYLNVPNSTNYGISFNREFISPSIKFAGGINLNWLEDKKFIYDRDSTIISKGFDNNQQEAWLGYATSFGQKKDENNYYIAGRFVRTDYTKFPTADTFKISYQNYRQFLGSVGYSYRRFMKDSYIFRLGRTEDIPIGKTFALTLGYENGAFFKRPYLGARVGYSNFFDGVGYFSTVLEWGSFRYANHWQDEIISSEILFYSKLIPLGTWRWRNFYWNRITYGYNTAPGKILNINQREGIRGFSDGYMVGNKKYVINYESVFFTPFNIVGFRTALSVFADFAFIGQNRDPLLLGKFYQAYGIGLRFRNEHLIFRTIQISLAYYPKVAYTKQNTLSFFEQSRAFYQFTNFQFSRPRVLEF